MTLPIKAKFLTAVLAGYGPIVFTQIRSAVVPKPPFRNSLPTPTEITLDPVIAAESLAIAAGVVIFVPFPAILFNRTLEENYLEVAGRVRRARRRLRAFLAMLLSWAVRRPRRPPASADPALEQRSEGRF